MEWERCWRWGKVALKFWRSSSLGFACEDLLRNIAAGQRAGAQVGCAHRRVDGKEEVGEWVSRWVRTGE